MRDGISGVKPDLLVTIEVLDRIKSDHPKDEGALAILVPGVL